MKISHSSTELGREINTSFENVPIPNHRDRDANANDDEGRLPGYQVRLRWWDNAKGHWTYVVPYIPAAFEPARVMTMYPLDQPVFFTFLMYESKPLYPRAIGRTLPHRDAVSVQEAAALVPPAAGGAPATASATLDKVPSLELLRDPNLWKSGEMRPLFPSHVHWSPDIFVYEARATRRIRPGILGVTVRGPSAMYSMSFLTLQRMLKDAKKSAHDAFVGTGKARMDKLKPECTTWRDSNVRANKPYHTLVYLLFVVAQWSGGDGGVDWWADDPHQHDTMRHMLTAWGPFQCVAPERKDTPLAHWNHAMLRAGVTILASVWLRLGDIRFQLELRERGTSFLDVLAKRVEAFAVDTLMPRWQTTEVETALFPPNSTQNACVFAKTYNAAKIHIGFVLKRMATAAGQAIDYLLPVPAKPHGLRPGEDDNADDDTADHVVLGPPTPVVALNSNDLHEDMKQIVFYHSSMQNYILPRTSPWRPTVDSLLFDGDTCIPAADRAPAPAPAPTVQDPNATWQALRGAVYLQLINNPSVSLVR